jgi:hypothetical protein
MHESTQRFSTSFGSGPHLVFLLDGKKENFVELQYKQNSKAKEDSKSEVARLMQQIDAEYEAGRQALDGLALGIAQHAFITQRMENMANQFAALRAIVGEEEAM